jgi:beta-carotene hydroxylase
MSQQDERAIARKYIGGVPWFMVIWGLGGFLLWLALWPLVILDLLPLWVAATVASIIFCYCYLPTHEAQHGNIGRPGSRWRWLNELVGHLSVLPLFFPYRTHRAIHLKHHAHTNEPDKDPDLYMQAESIWGAIHHAWKSKQPGQTGPLTATALEDAPNRERLIMEAFVLIYLGWFTMTALAWSGLALEVLLLWWIPKVISGIYTPVTLSWAPHHPMLETGRYQDTRGWKSPVGTLLSAGMEYHLVHHLFPAIPLHKTPAAYRELKPLLESEGTRLNGL